jgi:NAD(P)-dependent dehydrogenase (short-subunit alcohol dehydrogenase family)
MSLDGTTAIVTGAGSGIGAAVAIRLAASRASLVLCGRRPEPLEATRAACLAEGGLAEALPLDVRDEPAIELALDRASAMGPLRTAIASHGVNRLARAESVPLPEWEEIVSINLTGSFLVARAAARRMRRAGGGRIIVVSSVSGRPGYRKFPGFAAYAASKYALTGLVEVMTAELEGSGVTVALVSPAGVDTQMFRRTFPGAVPEMSVESVAARIVALADPATPLAPGTILDLTCRRPGAGLPPTARGSAAQAKGSSERGPEATPAGTAASSFPFGPGSPEGPFAGDDASPRRAVARTRARSGEISTISIPSLTSV